MIYLCLGEVYLYIHKREQLLLTDLRNELIEIEHIDHKMEIELDINAKKLISTTSTECKEDTHALTFDSCVENTIFHQLQDQCHLSFWNKINNESFCINSTGISGAMQVIQSSLNKCIPPCMTVKVNLRLNPVNWLTIKTNPKFYFRQFTPGYFIKIPSSVLYSEMNESYSLISFIAEFGGWIGLLLGVSILGAFELLESQICSSMTVGFKKAILSKSRLILKVACSLGVLIIVIQCGVKLIQTEKSIDVKLVENLNNLSISFCSAENIYQNSSKDHYLGNSTSFLNRIKQLGDKLEWLELVLEDGNSLTIYDSSQNQGSEYISYSINTPQFDTFIETCHSLDLKHWNRIQRMEVIAKKELTIYVHITGQLLRPGRQGFSFMNKDTTFLYARYVYLFCQFF